MLNAVKQTGAKYLDWTMHPSSGLTATWTGEDLNCL